MKEQLHQKEAFEYYYGLGKSRNVQKVAKYMSVSVAAVKKWSAVFKWQEKIQARDDSIGKQMEEVTDKAIIDEKMRYRKLIRAIVKEAAIKVKDGRLKAHSIRDVDTLIKLDLLLMGENPNVETETTINVKLTD